MQDEYHTNPSYIVPSQFKITKGLRTKPIVDREAKISAIADYDSLIGDIGDEQNEMNKLHDVTKETQRRLKLKKSSPQLDENLTGYKAISSEYSLETYIQKLVADGDVEDFYGNWGLVLSVKSKPYVYKLWYDDPPFEYYADFCLKNQNISFVPKVYGKVRTIPLTLVRDISQKDAKIKALKIEKLSPVTSWDEVTDIIFESINYNNYDNSNKNEMRAILQSSTSITELLSGYYGKLTTYGYQWVTDLIENMDKITNNGKMSKDIRLPNIMKTEDDRLKITDPVFDMSDSKGIAQLLDTVNSAEFTPDKKNFMVYGKNGEVSPLFVQGKFINHTLNWFCHQIDNTRDLVFPDVSDIDKLTFNQQFAILVSDKSPTNLKITIAKIIDIGNVKLVTDKYLKDIASGYLKKVSRQ
jgi:hypothetical protein